MKSIPFGQKFVHPSQMSPATRRILEIPEGDWFWCFEHKLSHEGCCGDDCEDHGPFVTKLECDEYGKGIDNG